MFLTVILVYRNSQRRNGSERVISVSDVAGLIHLIGEIPPRSPQFRVVRLQQTVMSVKSATACHTTIVK